MTLSSSLVTERVADTGSLAAVTPSGSPDGTKFLRDDLSWASPGVGPGSRSITAVKTSTYTAASGEIVRTDTSGGAFTLTLPLAPSDGAQVDWVDDASGGSWGTLTLTIGRNGATINGAASNLSVTRGKSYAAIYTSAITDWAVSERAIPSETLRKADNLAGLASTATSRTNLGVAIGTNVQAFDAELAAIAGLTSAADRAPYFTGSGTAALATFTSYARVLCALALTPAADKISYWTGAATAALTDFTATGRAIVGAASAGLARVALNQGLVTLTDAASIATDCSLGCVFKVTLGGNRTLANPTNVAAGATYTWNIVQDGTGSRTLALGANFYRAAGDTWAASTLAGAVDVISAVALDSSTLLIAFKKGY